MSWAVIWLAWFQSRRSHIQSQLSIQMCICTRIYMHGCQGTLLAEEVHPVLKNPLHLLQYCDCCHCPVFVIKSSCFWSVKLDVLYDCDWLIELKVVSVSGIEVSTSVVNGIHPVLSLLLLLYFQIRIAETRFEWESRAGIWNRKEVLHISELTLLQLLLNCISLNCISFHFIIFQFGI